MIDGADFDPSSLPDPVEIDWENLDSDNAFGEASFELLKDLVFTALPLASIVNGAPFERNEAILRACFLRTVLLGKSLLSDITFNDGYQQIQIGRQAYEVAANYMYLRGDDGSGDRFTQFINDQLAAEKHSLELIDQMIRKRGDDAMPIEKRMRQSMERMASAAGVDLGDVPSIKKTGWPSAFERFEAFGPAAYLPYRTGSSGLHGGWSALLLHELEEVEGGFTLTGRGSPPDTRPVLALAAMILLVADMHLSDLCGDRERAIFHGRLNVIGERRQRLDELHEEWIQS